MHASVAALTQLRCLGRLHLLRGVSLFLPRLWGGYGAACTGHAQGLVPERFCWTFLSSSYCSVTALVAVRCSRHQGFSAQLHTVTAQLRARGLLKHASGHLLASFASTVIYSHDNATPIIGQWLAWFGSNTCLSAYGLPAPSLCSVQQSVGQLGFRLEAAARTTL